MLASFDTDFLEIHEAACILMMMREDFTTATPTNTTRVVDNLGFDIPRRRMKMVRKEPRTPNLVFKMSLKRCFDQTTQNGDAGEEQEVEKEIPKTLKKAKRIVILPLPHMGMEQRPVVLPHMLRDHIHNMNGTDMVLVMEKHLTECDLSKQHNRLSIPRNKIQAHFLNPEEHNRLDAKQGINVLLVQPCMETIMLELKKWVMSNTFCYNLIGPWHKGVVSNFSNNLVKGCAVQLWRFRRDSKLCFALVKM